MSKQQFKGKTHLQSQSRVGQIRWLNFRDPSAICLKKKPSQIQPSLEL